MGAKSPGVYITENDISTYTVSDGSTVTAIIGYAMKGPIGTPVVTTSYQNFVDTFGSPTIVGYTGMAVKNIFAVGNTVIFYRVADETASIGKRIIKNAVAAVLGSRSFSKSSDVLVGTVGYENGKLYAVNVAENVSGAVDKNLYVRSPVSGKLSLSDILSQLSAQLSATAGFQEIKMSDIYANTGWYSFNFQVDDDVDSSEIAEIGGLSSVCSFIELSTSDKYDTIRAKVETAIKAGSNPMAILNIGKVGVAANYPVSTDLVGFTSTETCQFKVTINGAAYTLQVSVGSSTTFAQLTALINEKLLAYSAFAIFKDGTSSIAAKLVFVSKSRGVSNSIEVSPVTGSGLITQNIFMPTNGDGTVDTGGFTKDFIGVEESTTDYIYVENYTDVEGLAIKKNVDNTYRFDIVSDPYTRGLKFTSRTTGVASKIKFIDGVYGTSLLNALSGVGVVLSPIDGAASVNIDIVRDVADTKKIKFVSKTINAPIITAFTPTTYIGGLDVILLGLDAAITGSVAIEAYDKDVVAISSIKKGSGTSGIVVEKVTIVNPIDSALNTININVYSDGMLKETFSDVSMDITNLTSRFDIVINNTVENGGSDYVNFEYVKNESNNIVNFPDGTYPVGAVLLSTDVAATDSTDLTDYYTYDYAVGADGIPTSGGYELFVDALSLTGELANTDMYNYHILITPDNITQDVQDAAIALAEFRKDFYYICDSPFGLSSSTVKQWHNGLGLGRTEAITSSYTSTFWPWVKLYDTINKKYAWCPPSTVMAAKLVANDKAYGSWFAPAGELRGRIIVADIEYSPKLSERDDIYTGLNRVNPIVKFNDGRTVVFGEKTCLRENSALAKIHTRRMVIEIKKKVRAALQSFLFLPNVSDVWNTATSTINAILEPYKRGGGISYYNVVIDSSTTTAEMLQQDIMNGTIHIIPTGVIEDVEIALNVDKVGSTVTVA